MRDLLGGIHGEVKQFGDQVPCPLVDIVLFDELAHATHAQLFVRGLHLQSSADGFSGLIDVVGIDQECVTQFAGRSSELTEDEQAPLIASCSKKFLAYKIHSI